MGATVEQITIADEPERWAALGFCVEGDSLRVGAIELLLAGRAAGRGIVSWTLRGVATTELDGLVTAQADGAAEVAPAPEHPNGVTRVDHVVAISPALDRTVAVLQAAGLDLRRIREEPTPAGAPRQAFFRIGEAILEVIQEPDHVLAERGSDRPAKLWGMAFVAADLDAAAALIGEAARPVRDAVQAGRRIMPLAREAGVAVPVALMSERPR